MKHPQAKAAMAVQSARETLNMAPLAVITVNSVAVESYAGKGFDARNKWSKMSKDA